MWQHSNAVRPERQAASVSLPLYRPRIFNVQADVLARPRGRSDQSHAVRIIEAVPCTLRHDRQHSGAELDGMRAILSHARQRRVTGDNLDEFVAIGVALPSAFARRFAGEDATVSV